MEKKHHSQKNRKGLNLDGNGTLSADENQLMQQVKTIETLSGSKLSSEEIKKLSTNSQGGPPPGFVGGPPQGFVDGPSPHKVIGVA